MPFYRFALAHTPMKPLVLLCALVLLGCGERSADAPSAPPPPPTEPVPAQPVTGPALPYRVEGACPFECCTYGTWSAEQSLTVYGSPGDTTAVAFTVEAGTSFQADTGYVAVTRTGLVVIDQPTEVYVSYDDSRTMEPGDTLYVLDYVGEGAYNVWFADSVYQLPSPYSSAPPTEAGPPYRSLRDPEQTWWAHAVLSDGREGWLWMDQNDGGAIGGYDACGTP